jgi:hypothetical protein
MTEVKEWKNSDWTYHTKAFTEADISDNVGFVYKIENIQTGKAYIGKKNFTKAAYKQIKGKKKKVRKSSNWQDYWGSSEELLAVLKADPNKNENYKRTILKLCKSKGEMSYFEAYNQFYDDVLRAKLLDGSPRYYNSWIQCKIHRKHLKNK